MKINRISLKKITFSLGIMGLLLNPFIVFSQNQQLPEIGTAATSTLSQDQENEMGDFYIRLLRANTPLIYDPTLTAYINQLGNKLASHADSNNANFTFHLVKNDDINAFAFFGGHIVLHSALFRETNDENELASVVAHEIVHVTQRHLARAMEDEKRKAPLTWAGVLGGVLIGMSNPNAGMATVTGSMASSQQSRLTFTQSNEREADNIGVNILQKAGFDARGMNNFMQKMADNARFTSKPPEILLTHPLPDSRLADARSRLYQLPEQDRPSSEDYYFAKAKVLAIYAGNNPQNKTAFDTLAQGSVASQNAHSYGSALKLMDKNQFAKAYDILNPMYQASPTNLWFVDAMTDIDIGLGESQRAVTRIESLLKTPSLRSNHILQINLANAYLSQKQYAKANQLLFQIARQTPDDPNIWQLLAQSAAKIHNRSLELQARAENYALRSDLSGAITLLKQSLTYEQSKNDKARAQARINQLIALESRFKKFR
ncbi:beta-barrel assembly-enhancing protease [Thorsellia kenyensis]|uniref:Beta-barrel assembly-enhancing protease n=1 Tax=Thorsellia kenyensis TaxID=1549888 RepID=A0ABV6C827_9GAMM